MDAMGLVATVTWVLTATQAHAMDHVADLHFTRTCAMLL